MTNEELIQDMKDHITRGEYEGYALTNEECKQVIQALEQTSWIPVSERLPKKTGWYLITFNVYGGGYAVCEMSYRKPENYWTQNDIGKKILDNDEVVAWMPLPQPYKEEQDEKNNTDND